MELGVVIGMNGKNICTEDAMKHVAGYFVGLDFTNRTLQNLNKEAGSDWPLSKGSNDFAAVSEFIHKNAIADVNNVEIELKINGEVRQYSNTSHMIFDIPSMIADISRYQELRAGDLIFTGTPEGVGSVAQGDTLVSVLRSEGAEIVRLELDVI